MNLVCQSMPRCCARQNICFWFYGQKSYCDSLKRIISLSNFDKQNALRYHEEPAYPLLIGDSSTQNAGVQKSARYRYLQCKKAEHN